MKSDILAKLPSPFQTMAGEPVGSVAEWEGIRRPEVLDFFEKEVYGKIDDEGVEIKTAKERRGEILTGKAEVYRYEMSVQARYGAYMIPFWLITPIQGGGGSHPTFLNLFLRRKDRGLEEIIAAGGDDGLPVLEIVGEGCNLAVFEVNLASPDEIDGLAKGVQSVLYESGEPEPDRGGTIATWAWTARKIVGCLIKEPAADPKAIALVGHSRCGKAAIWACARDERIALTVSNNSGCTGSSPAKITRGETVEAINRQFPHWFSGNYKRWNNRAEEMPVDQHLLLASICPRLLYVASSSEDAWCDPEAEFLSAIAASEAYRLYGMTGLAIDEFPKENSPSGEGEIGYHVRTGKHALTRYDWLQFIGFFKAHLAEKE